MLPQFKPVTAIVIITGISLSAEAGFLTGAVAGICLLNFVFSVRDRGHRGKCLRLALLGFLQAYCSVENGKNIRKAS